MMSGGTCVSPLYQIHFKCLIQVHVLVKYYFQTLLHCDSCCFITFCISGTAVSLILVSWLMSQLFLYHLESFKLLYSGNALINLTYLGQ